MVRYLQNLLVDAQRLERIQRQNYEKSQDQPRHFRAIHGHLHNGWRLSIVLISREIFISILPCMDREPGGYESISCDYNDFTSETTYHFC